MKVFLVALFFGVAQSAHHTHAPPTTTVDPNSNEGRLRYLEQTLSSLTRQMMLQQLFVEERIRSDGDSGIKQLRHNHDGTRTFMTDSHSLSSVNSIHDHTNYKTTVGMGEVIAVLNGVEFRTRHNDYKLRMPHRTSSQYNAMEYIPFPKVPPSVLAKHTVPEQVEEMRNYFKAWKYQNPAYRDYRPYFKPVLCYMEGGWTTNVKSLDEPFQSDRHFIDADSWFNLQDKVRFTSYTGGKSNLENFSYLPSTIMNVNNGTPEFAQWNYRILCHPINQDLPLRTLEPIDDLAQRLSKKYNLTRFSKTRACRFNLAADMSTANTYDADKGYGTIRDKSFSHGLLDTIMNQIPGKNNYKANLTDHSFGLDVLQPLGVEMKPLNTGFYHRLYKYDKKGAMGTTRSRRGYADHSLYVAQTTQPQISSMHVKHCSGGGKHKNCTEYSAKYTYAIPLEIVYLTPLHSWNPYNLEYHSTDHPVAQGGSRIGAFNTSKAYNGTSNKYYYMTPVEFFSGHEVNHDKADTVKTAVGVLDRHGVVRKVAASGTRVFFPPITGVGTLRQRWPITPVHHEGSSIFKELDALKELVNHMPSYSHFFQEPPNANAKGGDIQMPDAHFFVAATTQDPPGRHSHEVYVDAVDVSAAENGQTIKATTSTDNQHSHDLDIKFDSASKTWVIDKCDGLAHCWDGHGNILKRDE